MTGAAIADVLFGESWPFQILKHALQIPNTEASFKATVPFRIASCENHHVIPVPGFRVWAGSSLSVHVVPPPLQWQNPKPETKSP